MSFGGLYISVSGIKANERSLDTISHNIANVNNADYVRQNVIHAFSRYRNIENGSIQVGTGVNVQEIRQMRDEFLDLKYRKENTILGYWQSQGDILGEIEAVFNEKTDSQTGLQDVLNEFWDGWDELYKEADSLTIRGVLHERAISLTETINHMSDQLNSIQLDLNKEILNEAEKVNTLLSQISELNSKITMTESPGSNIKANDFRDERNALIDELSELLPVDYYESNNHGIVVSLNGRDLINGEYSNPIEIKKDSRGFGYLYWSDTGEEIQQKEGGQLFGYIHARDVVIDKYRDKLNIFVKTIADKINECVKKGYDLEGNPGVSFFLGNLPDGSDIDASNIRVNPELSNFNKIAISTDPTERGNGEIIKKYIDDLKDKKFSELDGSTFEVYYRNVILDLGIDGNQASTIVQNQNSLLKEISDRKSSISGVSLEEEITDMINYQHSYIANTRVFNVIDEMMDLIINRMVQ